MGKVVLIEKDETLRKFFIDKLTSLKFEVISCKDGFEGIIKIKNEVPDLIITNLITERLDLFQILKEKNEYRTTANIPVLVISHRNDPETNQKLIKYKVNKILYSPLKVDQFLQFISEVFKIKIEIDRTNSIIDIHLNDDILFIEVINGLNNEKIDIAKYKIMQIKSIYSKKILNKIIIMLMNFQEMDGFKQKFEKLIDIVLEQTDATLKGIKILSINQIVNTQISMSKYGNIEIFEDFGKAIDALGKIDVFAYGDEITEIKTNILAGVDEKSLVELPIELSFSNEKLPVKDTYKIALIDDDLYILEFMATVLDRENWIINTYDNAKSFLRDFNDNKPDLIFLDLMMPEMNGFQLAKYLYDKNINIPIVIVTALSQKEMVMKAREFGITNFITKPIKAELLINKAEELLRGYL